MLRRLPWVLSPSRLPPHPACRQRGVLALLRPPLHIPRATLDPIHGPLHALAVVTLALGRPLRRELIAIACDDRHLGRSLSRFPVEGDAVLDAVDRMIGYCSLIDGAPNVVVGISEPDPARRIDRLADHRSARVRCRRAGLDINEWVVVTRGGASHAVG